MKKGILLLGLFLAMFSLTSTQQLNAQTTNSPWNGPKWASIQVTNTVSQWIIDNDHLPTVEGEWISTRYSYAGRGDWIVVISWGIGGINREMLGTTTLLVKSSGNYSVLS